MKGLDQSQSMVAVLVGGGWVGRWWLRRKVVAELVVLLIPIVAIRSSVCLGPDGIGGTVCRD